MSRLISVVFSRWFPLVLLALVMSGVFIILGTTASRGGPTPQFEPSGSPIYLRGSGVALLRLPSTVTPPQKVQIFDDGSVIRGLNPLQPGKSTTIFLNVSEREELDQLRTQWCQQIPAFPSVKPNEPFYDLGFKCDALYHVKQAKVPVDMLPAVFTKLLARLPPIPDP
jgi:hypothetical protein